jgi:hypothetical protein
MVRRHQSPLTSRENGETSTYLLILLHCAALCCNSLGRELAPSRSAMSGAEPRLESAIYGATSASIRSFSQPTSWLLASW